MMAKGASNCLFLSLLFLLIICSSGTLVGFSSHAAACSTSTSTTISFLQQLNKVKVFISSGRELLSSVKETAHDIILPPNNPTPTPTIVTVPSTTNPVTITPTNPAGAATPAAIPTTTPVTVPSTNPNNPTVPITNNPVTTPTPPPPITVPTGPVINPAPPPATTNAPTPTIPGQSWCVARTGALETSLQSALDYACGIGGADCSQIQQGANCYNPITLQNHASYAFNSYYQKNAAPTSCDFGGTATIVNTNPSSGSCIYPSSASQSTPTPPATTSSTTGAGLPGSVTPPAVLNSSSTPGSATSTTTVVGSDTPPNVNTSTSMSAGLQPFISCIILLTSFVAGVMFLDV